MRANNAPVGSESGKYFREAVEFNMPFDVELFLFLFRFRFVFQWLCLCAMIIIGTLAGRLAAKCRAIQGHSSHTLDTRLGPDSSPGPQPPDP